MKFYHLALILFLFGGANPLEADVDQPEKNIDAIEYKEIKERCYSFIYTIYRNLHIWQWPDAFIKEILQSNLRDYLITDLNTPESRELFAKYEGLDWNIREMINMHLSDQEC